MSTEDDPLIHTSRTFSGVLMLKTQAGRKLVVRCTECGLHRQYDANSMIRKVGGNYPMPDLLNKIAVAEGCTLILRKTPSRSACRLTYEM